MNQPDLVPVYRIFGLGRRDHKRLTGFRGFLEAGASAESPTLICLVGAASNSASELPKEVYLVIERLDRYAG